MDAWAQPPHPKRSNLEPQPLAREGPVAGDPRSDPTARGRVSRILGGRAPPRAGPEGRAARRCVGVPRSAPGRVEVLVHKEKCKSIKCHLSEASESQGSGLSKVPGRTRRVRCRRPRGPAPPSVVRPRAPPVPASRATPEGAAGHSPRRVHPPVLRPLSLTFRDSHSCLSPRVPGHLSPRLAALMLCPGSPRPRRCATPAEGPTSLGHGPMSSSSVPVNAL